MSVKAMAAALAWIAVLGCVHGPTHESRWLRFIDGGARTVPALNARIEWLQPAAAPAAEGRLAVLRAAPRARIEVRAEGEAAAFRLSAEAHSERLSPPNAVWNAGFYGHHGEHVGLLKACGRWLQRTWHPHWRGLLLTVPNRPGLPPWQLVDLDAAALDAGATDTLLDGYQNVVQSMVLLDERGAVRTQPSAHAAARTVLGVDADGQLVVVLTEGAWTLQALAEVLPSLAPPVLWAINLDGGLESQLTVRTGKVAEVSLTSRHGTRGAVPNHWTGRLQSRGLPAVLVLLPVPEAR